MLFFNSKNAHTRKRKNRNQISKSCAENCLDLEKEKALNLYLICDSKTKNDDKLRYCNKKEIKQTDRQTGKLENFVKSKWMERKQIKIEYKNVNAENSVLKPWRKTENRWKIKIEKTYFFSIQFYLPDLLCVKICFNFF